MPYCAYCGSSTAQVSAAPCPSCGKPSNGAPVYAPRGGTNTALIVVGVIVGALALVAIVGILAAIAIPNFLMAKGRASQKRTMADVRMIATAVEAYKVDKDAYPRAASMEELHQALSPTYIQHVPRQDGWGTGLRYSCLDAECQSYAIASAGSDKVFEHEDLSQYVSKATSNHAQDIVFKDGEFLQYPEATAH